MNFLDTIEVPNGLLHTRRRSSDDAEGNTVRIPEQLFGGASVNDCLIGGTAIVHKLVLVSRNVRHFEKITELLREVW